MRLSDSIFYKRRKKNEKESIGYFVDSGNARYNIGRLRRRRSRQRHTLCR